jgi:hypothetical protein
MVSSSIHTQKVPMKPPLEKVSEKAITVVNCVQCFLLDDIRASKIPSPIGLVLYTLNEKIVPIYARNLFVHTKLRAEGAGHISPGQRPGVANPQMRGALKGRDINVIRHDAYGRVLRPFRACFSLFIHSQGVALG